MIRVTPLLLVRQLMDRRATSHWLGTAEHDGRPHDVVTLVMEVGPALSLYFDQASHLLTYSERQLPGFGLVEYHFEDYDTKDGFPINMRFRLSLNGDPNLDWQYSSATVNGSFDDRLAPPTSLTRIAAVTPDELSLQELADGVFLVGGTGTYAMFVEMDEFVVAIGGTAGIPDRIAELRKQVPSKPIRYGVLTHHHSDHTLGVPAYAEEGATIVAAQAHESVIRSALGDEATATFEFVKDTYVITDGTRRVELYDIGPTPHAEHILLPYLPAEGLVFEADHIARPRTGPLPPAISGSKALAKAMDDRGLKVSRIAGAHSPRVITVEEFNQALARDSRVASQ
jgi:glyoxylase-like metal-dependent hydrolase (beta-lactamase superfamily II)